MRKPNSQKRVNSFRFSTSCDMDARVTGPELSRDEAPTFGTRNIKHKTISTEKQPMLGSASWLIFLCLRVDINQYYRLETSIQVP